MTTEEEPTVTEHDRDDIGAHRLAENKFTGQQQSKFPRNRGGVGGASKNTVIIVLHFVSVLQ